MLWEFLTWLASALQRLQDVLFVFDGWARGGEAARRAIRHLDRREAEAREACAPMA